MVALAAVTFGMIGASRARAEERRQRQAAERARGEANNAIRLLRDVYWVRRDSPETRDRLSGLAARLDAGWLRDQPEAHAGVRAALGFANHIILDWDNSVRQLDAALRLNPDYSLPPRATGLRVV